MNTQKWNEIHGWAFNFDPNTSLWVRESECWPYCIHLAIAAHDVPPFPSRQWSPKDETILLSLEQCDANQSYDRNFFPCRNQHQPILLQPPVQHGKSELVPTCIHLSMPLRCFESTNSRQSSGTPDGGCHTLVRWDPFFWNTTTWLELNSSAMINMGIG